MIITETMSTAENNDTELVTGTYNQLTDGDKNYDRETIIGKPPPPGEPHKEQFGYIDIVKTAGFRVQPKPALPNAV